MNSPLKRVMDTVRGHEITVHRIDFMLTLLMMMLMTILSQVQIGTEIGSVLVTGS